jgi:ElaB/YqjD/DUF883 family membrane-anchored ribosome-binding protein
MGEDPGTAGAPVTVGETRDPDQIRDEIEATRRELGDTVEALAYKADVKARVHDRIDATRESVAHKFGKARDASPDSVASGATQATEMARKNPLPVAAVGAFVGGFLLGRLTKRA